MADTFAETVDLIRAARTGNQGALEAVVARYRGPLLERIRLMMGSNARSAADSGDFLQGLFVEILRGFDSLQRCDERSFLRWATGLARNNIRDAVRRRRELTIGQFASSLEWRPARGHGDTPSPQDNAANLEQVDLLVDALCDMPADYRRVIELRHFEGLSFVEIGHSMQRSENAAQILHSRALVYLGELLRGD